MMQNPSRPVRVAVAILAVLFPILVYTHNVYARDSTLYARDFTPELVNRLSQPNVGFDIYYLVRLFARMGIVEGEKEPPWCQYQKEHIETHGSASTFSIIGTTSLQFGIDYYREHKQWFDKAQARFPQVPPEIILATLRLESYFSRCLGNHESLPMLYNTYKYRSDRRNQAFKDIRALIRMCLRDGCDPNVIQSSSAGALGPAQFLPYSIEVYGVDGDENGRIDLYTKAADADSILSIPNYFIENGWKVGDRRAQKKAVRAYNNDDLYIALLFKYANAIRPLIQQNN